MKKQMLATNKDKGIYYSKKLMRILGSEFKEWKKQNDLSKLLEPLKHAGKTGIDIAANTANLFVPSNKEKLNHLLKKIESVNTLNERYLEKEEELNSLKEPIKNLLEIRSEFKKGFKRIEMDSSKNSMRKRIELRAQIDITKTELSALIAKKDELTKEMAKLKKSYLKEYTNLEKMFANKENITLLTAREQRLKDLSIMLDVNTSFEDAVDRFTVTLFEIIDSSEENMIGNEFVQVYEDNSVIESKFDIDGTEYLVSISTTNDSIKIGVIKEKKIILVGAGFNFYEIDWKREHDNSLIIHLYNRLRTLKKDIHYKNDLEKNISKLKIRTS